MAFWNRDDAPRGVVEIVAEESRQAAALARIEGQEQLADPRTHPGVRRYRDALLAVQLRHGLDADHARRLRRYRVADRRAHHAEQMLTAVQRARDTASPARSVLALYVGRRRYLRGCMAASLLLAAGSARGVEQAALALGAPVGTGYLAEVGLTVLSTAVILYRSHLAEHGGKVARGWQGYTLLALMVVPLLASVAANIFKGGIVGGLCALGAAAFGALGYIISDRSADAMRAQADRVTEKEEETLRAAAMGEDAFDTAPAPRPTPTVMAPEHPLTEAELVAIGADAERVRAYLNRFGIEVNLPEISPILAATPRTRTSRTAAVPMPEFTAPRTEPSSVRGEVNHEPVREPAGEPDREPQDELDGEPGDDLLNHEVRAVVNLIDERGYDAITLPVVERELGLKKTTAYNRLTEARRYVNQRANQSAAS